MKKEAMKDKRKIAVIGCGYWGQNLVRNFAELNVLAAVCDSNPEQARKMADLYQVDSLTIDQILKNPSILGVVIAAPAVQHAALTAAALKAGKHVFVEKPLALRVDEAQYLCNLAQEHTRVLMVGHLLQYHPAFLELSQQIKKGKLGKLLYIYSNRLNLGKFRNEENILWSFAPHDISMILSLANSLPKSVYATGLCHLNSNIADITTTHLSFASGVEAHIFVSWLHPYKEQKLIVVGDRGMAVFDDGRAWGEKLQLYPHQVNWIDGVPTPSKAEPISIPLGVAEPLKLECQHFLECLSEDQKPRTDGFEGLRVLQVLDAAQKSMNSKRRISLQEEVPLFYKHDTAFVDSGCDIGEGTKIWHFSHILKGTKVGRDCVIGQNVMIGPDVIVGDRCKIQNNVSLYKGVVLEEGVFCGPSCVFTNVFNPRAEVERKEEFRQTYVEKGVSIGANATIVCGTRLGAYSFIGAGAVVLRDVKPHAVMVGNPARQIGWMSHAGEKLGADLVCPREGRRYYLTPDHYLKEIEDESRSCKTA
jgi:UDP-2-acetamido-3-amino-2,3-dideoxy-glucuronate N-acetyltransferase